mgnify:CR=1 FL=1
MSKISELIIVERLLHSLFGSLPKVTLTGFYLKKKHNDSLRAIENSTHCYKTSQEMIVLLVSYLERQCHKLKCPKYYFRSFQSQFLSSQVNCLKLLLHVHLKASFLSAFVVSLQVHLHFHRYLLRCYFA